MILEQLSEKRLKISALNSDADLPQLFIINVIKFANFFFLIN